MKRKNTEKGFVLIGVLITAAILLILAASSLSVSGSGTRTIYASDVRSHSYYETEATMNSAVQWFRKNSTSLALLFSRSNFYTNFDRVSPSKGANDTTGFAVPTKIRMNGTNNSVILSNYSGIGPTAFPSSTDASTGASFAAGTVFPSASLGPDKVRVTLVDVVANDPTKDYGDTDLGNPAPDTDFYPIYRVDAATAQYAGTHLVGYLVGSLITDYGIGFYGHTKLELRQKCDSYISNSGQYSSASKRANCTVGSGNLLQLHQNEIVYGSARSKGTIDSSSPFGGSFCSDFTTGCPNKGQTCAGASCTVSGLPTYSSWSTYCPTNQGNVTVSSSTTLNVAGNSASQKCWNTVTLNNNKVLTLQSTTYPYFIDTFSIPNNGRINFDPQPSTGTINLYVKNFSGNKFNGNQVFNVNNKPYQLRIHYLGTADLTMNGTADMSSFLVAPYANVNVQGNFIYKGGIKALGLSMTGSAEVHYDESGDIATISDTTYKIRNLEQGYR